MDFKKKIIVSVTNDLYTDQRVHKVCMTLIDLGFEVLLVGRLRKNSIPLPKREYSTHRMKLIFDKGALFYAEYNFRLFLFLLFRKCNVLVSNDLDTLLANFLVKKLKRNVELVYDSHEYFTEVPELVNRPKIKRIWEKIEEFIFPKLENIFTVNNSIAGKYSLKYKKKLNVLRNISPSWNPLVTKTRTELGLPEDRFIVIIQGAGINIDRGAEEAVEAIQSVDSGLLIIVGDGDVIPTLKTKVTEMNWGEKVKFIGKKPYHEMMNYTLIADLGLTLDKPNNLNYKFSLPNKVFDYIHGNTPVLASNVVEVKKIIENYQVGKVMNDFSLELLRENLIDIKNNPEELNRWKENCHKAKLELNWENESNIIKEVYGKFQ